LIVNRLNKWKIARVWYSEVKTSLLW